MQFLYHPDSGNPSLTIGGEEYRHLFRARRQKKEEMIHTRNLQDHQLHLYQTVELGKKEALLELVESHHEPKVHPIGLTIGWCLIDPKSIEKALPSLNELGIENIAFFPCARSQKNYQIDSERCSRILIRSCEQCGRSLVPRLEIFDSLSDFLQAYPESYLLDFHTEKTIDKNQNIKSIVIGCEGGFSEEEREVFQGKVVKTTNPLIMKSETAAMAAASVLLL